MTFKILNRRFAGQTVSISNESVAFDENGIGKVKSEDLYNNVLNAKGFYHVDENGDAKKKPEYGVAKGKTSKVDSEGEKVEEEEKAPKLVKLAKSDMTHEELDEIAEELGILEDEDYPKKEKKNIKVAFINTEATEQNN